MSKSMVNALKAQVGGLTYADLMDKSIKNINFGYQTYLDLKRALDLTINGQDIAKDFIQHLYLEHKSFITKDKDGNENYRPFLREVFVEIFKSAKATIPNDFIIEELITSYNQGGYIGSFSLHVTKALEPFDLSALGNEKQRVHIDCEKPDCLKFSFSYGTKYIYDHRNYLRVECNLYNSAEFKLKCKDGNVTYEDGKVLLIISKELENYKTGDDNLFNKLIDIINKIIEYFKKLCEKLGFKFDIRIEYDPERIKIEHNLGKPLKVIDKPGISSVNDSKSVGNPR